MTLKHLYPTALIAAFLFIVTVAYVAFGSALVSSRAVVYFHILFIVCSGSVVLYSDEQGFMWMRGKLAYLSHRKSEWLHALVGLCLAGTITTGGLLFLQSPSLYLSNATFITKMVFVAALIINGFFISAFTHIAATKQWRELSPRERVPLLISGAISVVGWGGAALCGLLLP